MWEKIRDCVIIDYPDKSNRVVESVVETVQVDKENSIMIGILDFGNFACPWIK